MTMMRFVCNFIMIEEPEATEPGISGEDSSSQKISRSLMNDSPIIHQ